MKNRASIALGFLALILVGAILLSSPWARQDGVWGAWGDSLFTSCSAVCVTGLSVVDIGTTFTRGGLVALTVLVELGCLGLMTFGTFLVIAVGRRLSLHSEFSLMNAYGVPAVKGLKGLVCWVVGSMLSCQAIGASVLYGHGLGLFRSVFYSIMSFCNAGFSLYGDSLARWADDPVVLLTLGVLTMLGGLGFMVMLNLVTFKFLTFGASTRGCLSLHTKTVLRVSAWLLVITFALFQIFEWNHALAGMAPLKRLTIGFFQSVTPRTCGFCVLPTESLQPITRLVYEVMMFFGGAPGSAAGGMKVTTLAVLAYTLTAMCHGEAETVIGRRTIPLDIVRESIVIVMAVASLITLAVAALMVTEAGGPLTPDALFFESVSAVTTTGLSVGNTTSRLSAAGRVILMAAMFCGRLGALTVVMMIGDRESKRRIRFPSEELVVG